MSNMLTSVIYIYEFGKLEEEPLRESGLQSASMHGPLSWMLKAPIVWTIRYITSSSLEPILLISIMFNPLVPWENMTYYTISCTYFGFIIIYDMYAAEQVIVFARAKLVNKCKA